MKITTFFLIAIISVQLNGCKSQKNTAIKNVSTKQTLTKPIVKSDVNKNISETKPLKSTTKNTQQKEMTIIYETSSRGSRESIVINGSNAQFKNYFRGKSTSKSKTLNDKNVKELKAVLERIDYKRFSKIEAPSKKHQFDGAPAASITVFNGKQSITCPTFDAGNPPSELKDLVAKLLSFKK